MKKQKINLWCLEEVKTIASCPPDLFRFSLMILFRLPSIEDHTMVEVISPSNLQASSVPKSHKKKQKFYYLPKVKNPYTIYMQTSISKPKFKNQELEKELMMKKKK